jgi:Ser/Thr protein kinase RdoA (MazF antagonist)
VTADGAGDPPDRLLGPEIRAGVERLLADAWGAPVTLVAAEPLADRAHVVRVTTADGRSAVVKRPGDGSRGRWGAASHGIAVERAGLEHLAAMPGAPVPALLGGDGNLAVIVLEDLAVERTMAGSLLGADAERAWADVVALGAALGAVHGWSIGRADAFAALRAAHGVARPDRTWWGDVFRAERAPFLDALDRLGLGGTAPASALEGEFDALDTALAGERWRGFVHGDPCPDNAVVAAGRARLLDLERCSPGSIALDAAYLLAPFPSCWCFGRVPQDLARAGLAAHRRALADHGIMLGDGWDVAVAAALGAWVVIRGSQAAESVDDTGRAEVWGTTTMRPRLLAWADAFVTAAAAPDAFPRLHAVATALRDRLRTAWPDEEVPHYPPFAPPGGALAARPEGWTPAG